MSEIEIREKIEQEEAELRAWLIPVEKEIAYRNGRIQALRDLLPKPPQPPQAVVEARPMVAQEANV